MLGSGGSVWNLEFRDVVIISVFRSRWMRAPHTAVRWHIQFFDPKKLPVCAYNNHNNHSQSTTGTNNLPLQLHIHNIHSMMITNISLVVVVATAFVMMTVTHGFVLTATGTRTIRSVTGVATAMSEQPMDSSTTEKMMPSTYAQCGRCQSSYPLSEDDLGPTGKGRYV